jgi:hypothetical protein
MIQTMSGTQSTHSTTTYEYTTIEHDKHTEMNGDDFFTISHHLTIDGVSKQVLIDISISGIGTVDEH